MLRKSLIFGAVAMTALYSVSAIAQECKPSKWGAKDEIGAANYVTPKQVLMAAKLVKKGESRQPDSVDGHDCCEFHGVRPDGSRPD